MKNKLFYLTPGPTNVPESVLQAMHRAAHHREPDLVEVYKFCRENLPKFFQNSTPTIIMGSSGTGAMETSLSNTLSQGDKVIVVHSGHFGLRFEEMVQAWGCIPIPLTSEFGTYPDPEDLKKLLKKHPDVKAVTACHSETTTGVLAPISSYAECVAETPAIFIVDTVSSSGALPINQERDKIDICLGASQKGFMLPPGLSFLSLYGDKVHDAIKKSTLPKYYFNIPRYIDEQERLLPDFTPPTATIFGLKEALSRMLAEGLDNGYARRAEVAQYVRDRSVEMGLPLLVKEGYTPSDTCTCVVVDHVCHPSEIVKKMFDRGIYTMGGVTFLKDKILRIGVLGEITLDEIKWGMDVLEECVNELR